MNNFEFYRIILENIYLFCFILLISFLIHYLFFRKLIYTILDPYLLPVISSVFSFTVVVFLSLCNEIPIYTFTNFIFTEFSFWVGLFFFKKPNILKKNYAKQYSNDLNKVSNNLVISSFYFFSFIFIISQFIIYYIKGIPLFMESRLETFSDGGGLGFLGRITDICSIFSIYSFFLSLKTSSKSFLRISLFSVILFTLLLSGSKSSFLIIFFVFFSISIIKCANNIKNDLYFKVSFFNKILIACFTLFFVLSIIFIQSKNDALNPEEQLNPFFSLLLRFVHSGDIYWYSYANDVYKQIDNKRWFTALFNDFLGLFRIFKWNELPEAIGITLKNIHHPSDVPQGPNARHNVFGLIYFGYIGSIIFSFLIGFIISFIRNKLPLLLKFNLLNGFIFTYLLIKVSGFDSDPMLTITYFDNLLFIFPFLYLANLLFSEIIFMQFHNINIGKSKS